MRKMNLLMLASCLTLIIFTKSIQAQEITIDLVTEYQTVRGFGGMSHTSWRPDLSADQRVKAFNNAPGNLGLSILRMHIDPDSNRFKDHVQTARYAQNQGAILFGSPWDPPAALLEDIGGENHVKHDMYDEYVNHLNSFNKLMADSGISLYAISVQNEPDFGEWTRWTSAEMVNFLKYNAQNIDTRVIAPESFQFRREYTDPILNDSVANSHVNIIGGHIYGAGLYDYPLAREKGNDVWMTEHLLGSEAPEVNTWDLALTVACEINDCMEANFNAYIYWYIYRFYGLINEDGNITKKGYVMSQFSKFIRFGAVRVKHTITNATDIEATAYKTDSSVVIVVINKNNSEAEVNFTLENGTTDTLTMFTTTADKNLTNKGGVSIAAGTFSATLEPKSITTFTTYTENGESFGNAAPVANAGEDITIDDTDGSGAEVIMIDASASLDPDGSIVNFNWSLNGVFLTNDTTYELSLPTGKHVFLLTVTDNDGTRTSDTLNVTINNIYNTELWFEAECAQVGSTWEINTDATASNGYYINTPAGTESVNGAQTDTANLMVIEFEVTEASNYKVWARVKTPSATDDSYWVNMDNSATWTLWNGIPASNEWHWDDVHDQSNDNTVLYNLSVGSHVLKICYREDGALLDKILIANTGISPDGLGGNAETCYDEPNSIALVKTDQSLCIFPNPATNAVKISSEKGYDNLMIYNIDGKILLKKVFSTTVFVDEFFLDVEPGMYFLSVQNKNQVTVKKLIVE